MKRHAEAKEKEPVEMSKRAAFAAGICLPTVILVGILDYHTGYRLSVSLLYLAPVLLASWVIGRRAGLLVAVLGMLTWFFADASLRREGFSNPVVYWNAVVRFGFFATAALLLASLKSALDRERVAARVDLLTGLANSRAFYEDAEAELARARRYNHPLTVAYLDLDNFKMVNDLYGHREGDRLIGKTAQVMRAAVRSHDIVARVGGDEFVMLMPETESEDAKPVFERLADLLHKSGKEEKALRNVTASIGVVSFETAPASVAAMVWAADMLMYKVKHTGKNGCRFEVEPGSGSAHKRLEEMRRQAVS